MSGTWSASTPPASSALGVLLGSPRQVVSEATALRGAVRGGRRCGRALAGSTCPLIGLGKISTRVAAVGQAFGMDVVAWSPHLDAERADAAGVRLAPSLGDALAQGDFVSLHLVLSDSTRGLIGAAELAAMRPTAYLVNTSRAGLGGHRRAGRDPARGRSGASTGAGLDVYDVEPLPLADRLRSLPNVLGTPHLGYVTEGNYRTYFTEAVEDVAAWLAGEPVRRLG